MTALAAAGADDGRAGRGSAARSPEGVARAAASSVPPFFVLDDAGSAGRGWPRRLGSTVPVADDRRAPRRRPPPIPDRAAGAADRAAAPGVPGQPDTGQRAGAVSRAIERARRAGAAPASAAGVVTNPIQKKALYDAGFRHPGHTEYLAELGRRRRPPVMMLACPELRVVPVTIHMSLAEAVAAR